MKEHKYIDKNKTLKAINEISKKNAEANKLVPKFIELDGSLENVELVFTKTDGTKYEFNCFSLPVKFIAKIHNSEITLEEAMQDQTKTKILINKLSKGYNPINLKNIKEKKRVLESSKILSNARDEIINLFEKETFPYKGHVFKTKEKSEEESEELDENEFFKNTDNESEGINYDLFEKHFKSSVPTVLAKILFQTKNKN